MMTNNYQQQINQTPPGGTLKLDPPRDEVQGPLVIRQPMTLVGQGGTLWCERGPVLTVQTSGVVLRDLNIEVTGPQSDGSDAEACALAVEPGQGITLDGVVVRGIVLGLRGEEGAWRYPRTVRLPVLQADTRHTFTLRLLVPVACQLTSDVAGVEVSPQQLPPGRAEICVAVDALKDHTRLRGFLTLRSPLLLRRIHLTCTVQAQGGTTGRGEVVFSPTDWDTLPGTASPSPSEPDPRSLPTIDDFDLDLPSPLETTAPPPELAVVPQLTIDPTPAPAATPAPAPRTPPRPTPTQPVVPNLSIDDAPAPVAAPTPVSTPVPAAPASLPLNPGVDRPLKKRHSRRDTNLANVFLEPPAETPAEPAPEAEATPAEPVVETPPATESPKKPPRRGKRGPVSSLFLEPEPPEPEAGTE